MNVAIVFGVGDQSLNSMKNDRSPDTKVTVGACSTFFFDYYDNKLTGSRGKELVLHPVVD